MITAYATLLIPVSAPVAEPGPGPNALFDGWRDQGLLLLNTGLTISRFGMQGSPEAAYQFSGHLPLWKPVVARMLTAIAARSTGHVVFLLWGKPARDRFAETGARAKAEAAGTWGTRVRMVTKPHPAAGNPGAPPPFLDAPNIFSEVNAALVAMGGEPIVW